MRPIDGDALLKTFENLGLGENGLMERIFADGVYTIIENAPTIEAEPVRHGKWGAEEIVGYDGIHPVYALPCSECGKYTKEYLKPFCQNCGAKMDLK